MRTIYHTLLAALFLVPLVGCNHTAGYCDCDSSDPCVYCPKPYPVGPGAGFGCGCQGGAPEHLAPVADAVVK